MKKQILTLNILQELLQEALFQHYMLSGYSADEIYELFQKYANKLKYVDLKNIFKLIGGLIVTRKIIIDGLNSGITIEKIMKEACIKKKVTNIKDVPKKLLIPSVDLNTGKVYIFSSLEEKRGYSDNIEYIRNIPIEKAVRASCSYPRCIFSMYI